MSNHEKRIEILIYEGLRNNYLKINYAIAKKVSDINILLILRFSTFGIYLDGI